MEEGNLRCDPNSSGRPTGTAELGVKTEVKNMNSFKNVQRALEYEIERQIGLLKSGQPIVQETHLWDATQGVTLPMRGKEEAHDYRYFPEPDRGPVEISPAWVEEIAASLPELPAERRQRFVQSYGLPEYAASILTTIKALTDFFEECTHR